MRDLTVEDARADKPVIRTIPDDVAPLLGDDERVLYERRLCTSLTSWGGGNAETYCAEPADPDSLLGLCHGCEGGT